MRALILSTYLALGLLLPAWGQTSNESAPDWPELENRLNEIDSGLQMTEAPLSEIESYFGSESERLAYEKDELSKERERLRQEKSSLDLREQELNEREADLKRRESGLADMQADLDRANKKLKRARVGGILAALGAAAAGGFIGWLAGR